MPVVNNVPPAFAVDVESETVLLMDGSRYSVDSWFDEMAQPCLKEQAASCVFQGPRDLWFAVDIDVLHEPDVVH